MLTNFLTHIKENELCHKSDKILLAVSGGVDSVVMAELFHRAGYNFEIAHCNFLLRGEESDQDENFVKNIASKTYKTHCHIKRFDTKLFAVQNKLSIQEAARKLRYEYFEDIRKKEGFDFIATAHHADDQIETFFINLLRGSGISGLAGIPLKQNNIIRPMLFALRSGIEDFAEKNNISYRSDSSNKENKYLRNKIRNKLLPVLEKIIPEYRSTIDTSIRNLKNTEIIYRIHLEKISLLKTDTKGLTTISIKELKKLNPCPHFLYEFISQYGFNSHVCEEICKSLNTISGKIFFSQTHRLVKDRENLIIETLKTADINQSFIIEEGAKQIHIPIKLNLAIKKRSDITTFVSDKYIAMLDKDKLQFPLILKRWKKGDYFYPLGMKNKKKLSDFFSDNKFSVIDKSNVWLLCSEEQIVWIIGCRIDNRFKINNHTQNILLVKWLI